LPEASTNRVFVRFSADSRSVAIGADSEVEVWNVGRRDAATRLATFASFVGGRNLCSWAHVRPAVEQLFLGETTIKTHVSRVLSGLDVYGDRVIDGEQ
jgi:hypothetical protein